MIARPYSRYKLSFIIANFHTVFKSEVNITQDKISPTFTQ